MSADVDSPLTRLTTRLLGVRVALVSGADDDAAMVRTVDDAPRVRSPARCSGGTLLGAQPLSPWPQRTEALERGDRLVLYTDGLVERPGEPLDAAIADLFTGRTAAAGDLDALCDGLLESRPAARRDDAAILAVAIR